MIIGSTVKEVVKKLLRRNPRLRSLYVLLHTLKGWSKAQAAFLRQKALIKKCSQDEKKIIVFLIPETEGINGGTLSIFSLCAESRRFEAVHGAKVLLATFPGRFSHVKNTLFKNNEIIFNLPLVLQHFCSLTSLILHIPEYVASSMFNNLSSKDLKNLKRIAHVHINILNQNTQLMSSPDQLIFASNLCHELTQTTAHSRYCTQTQSDAYQMPVHLFSTGVDKNNYVYTPWKNKEDILIVSPDPHPEKAKILQIITCALPHIKQVVIQNMPYEDFKILISKAKFALTFGEGFDGYYIEPTFCGSIGFTVYNKTFFPSDDFQRFFGVYDSYEQLQCCICDDVKRAEKEDSFREKCLKEAYTAMEAEYSFAKYLKNIENFYREKYTFTPQRKEPSLEERGSFGTSQKQQYTADQDCVAR